VRFIGETNLLLVKRTILCTESPSLDFKVKKQEVTHYDITVSFCA